MNIFKKMGYNSKAKEIANRREMQYLFDFDFEDLCEEIKKQGKEDFALFADLTLFAFYRYPCAYTANNVIALYVDLYNGKEIEEDIIPDYEFFLSVGAFLEKGSAIEDVFDCKEYYMSLAQYHILKDDSEMKKAFDLLVGMPVSFMDSNTQYLVGMLYYVLGMTDIAKKVLETSLDDMSEKEKASASLILAKLLSATEENTDELLKNAVKSNKVAVLTDTVTMLNQKGGSKVVVDNVSLENAGDNPELFYALAVAFKNCGKEEEFCAYAERYEGDELYETLLEKAMDGEPADVQMINREINQRQMDEMMESELYEYADDTTKRMINKQILETASNENEFLERDYMELIPFYIE